MKKIIPLVLIAALSMLFYQCENKQKGNKIEKNELKHPKIEDVVSSKEHEKDLYFQNNSGIKFITSQTEYSIKNNDEFEYSIYNLDNYQVLTGSSFILNYWNKNTWVDYQFDHSSYDIQYIITKDNTKTFKRNLLHDEQYPMRSGKYRIIKDLIVVSKEGVGERRIQLYSEFSIVD